MDTKNLQNNSVDNYISSFPEEVRKELQLLRKVIKEEIPDAGETISYGIPTFKLNGKYVVYFAAYKKHISLYPISQEIVSSLGNNSSFKLTGKGTLQFPLNKPLPIPVIRIIIKGLLGEYLMRQQVNPLSKSQLKINKEWHSKNRMPKNPTLNERLEWHKKHKKYCACRPVPASLRDKL